MSVTDNTCAPAKFIWTDDRVEELKRLYLSGGMSAGIVAGRMGVTRNAVIGKINRLDLRRRESKPSVFKPSGSFNRARKPPKEIVRSEAKPMIPAIQPSSRPLTLPTIPAGMALWSVSVDDRPQHGYHILDCGQRMCRWPTSTIGDRHFFCGDATVDGRAYCADHCRKAFA